MSQMRREKCAAARKDSRWDRIRKRYGNGAPATLSLKTDVVRRFIEMDFIGKNNERLLNGEQEARTQLNPTLVMDMRHEVFRRTAQKLPLATLAHQRGNESCVAHNVAVEERYIDNELNKLRQQLQKDHQRNRMHLRKAENSLQLDNEAVRRSLEATSRHIADFYAAPVEALQEMQELCAMPLIPTEADSKEMWESDKKVELEMANATEQTDEQEENLEALGMPIRTPNPLTLNEELCQHVSTAAEEHQKEHTRCVRFDEGVEVRKYQRESSSCSNTSDGLDSVISDLAEEALMELRMEEATAGEKEEVQHEKGNEEPAQQTEATDGTQKQLVQIAGSKVSSLQIEGASVARATAMEPNELLVIQRLQLPAPSEKRSKKTAMACTTDDDDESEDGMEESTSNHEQNAIIEQLFKARTHTNIATMRKHFLKWIHYVTIEKIERENLSSKHDRVHMINAFLDKIRKEKVRHRAKSQSEEATGEVRVTLEQSSKMQQPAGTVQVTKKYQSKIKMQQDIIDLQRLKLERQERLIMELKLHKLSDEAKEARQEIKNELKSVIRSGDAKAKAKAKCLQIIGNLRDTDDEELARLRGTALLAPKFLQNMQERALERSVRHEQARQRRLQHDAEREAQKIAAEEAKRLEDEEAKHMRIEALKEKRRLEKMAKIIKERERQRALENQRKSQEFCRRLLLRSIGMEGFKRLLQRKRDNHRKCEALRRQHYKRSYFMTWRDYCVLQAAQKLLRAEQLHHKILKRQALAAWQRYMQEERSKHNVAVDWHELKLSECTFVRWYGYTQRMRMIEETKMRQATSHHEWHLKWKVLDCWQRLPQILQLEKETEERRQRWRMKIWELLPDYTPNRDNYV